MAQWARCRCRRLVPSFGQRLCALGRCFRGELEGQREISGAFLVTYSSELGSIKRLTLMPKKKDQKLTAQTDNAVNPTKKPNTATDKPAKRPKRSKIAAQAEATPPAFVEPEVADNETEVAELP